MLRQTCKILTVDKHNAGDHTWHYQKLSKAGDCLNGHKTNHYLVLISVVLVEYG